MVLKEIIETAPTFRTEGREDNEYFRKDTKRRA
jgi:hypothetical protein